MTKAKQPTPPPPQPGQCQFWLPMRARYCGWNCKPGHSYCGNHIHAATGEGEKRIPCPANPKHHILPSQLEAHLRKCPKAIEQAAARAHPYFCENINTGAVLQHPYHLQQGLTSAQQQHTLSAEGSAVAHASTGVAAVETAAAIAAEAGASFQKGIGHQRLAAATALGQHGMLQLVDKINAAHAALTAAYPAYHQLMGGCEKDPESMKQYIRGLDPLMPFDYKHAVQYASIVGNMGAAGLLQDPQRSVFVELGAGKGFLTAWLHQIYGAEELIMLDRQGNFCGKADRRLRKTRLTRVAIDLKDAALLPLLTLHMNSGESQQLPQQGAQNTQHAQQSQHNARHHAEHAEQQTQQAQQAQHTEDAQDMQSNAKKARRVACTSSGDRSTATHGGLICSPNRPPAATVARPQELQNKQQQQCNGQHSQQQYTSHQQQQRRWQQQQQQPLPWVAHGKHLCGAATDFALRACLNAPASNSQACSASGIGSFSSVNSNSRNSGCSDGHQQPQMAAGVCSNRDGSSSSGSNSSNSSNSNRPTWAYALHGLAIATCCHHRCGWTAYCGKEALAAYDINKQEFEILAWLTSWALCGHEAALGGGNGQQDGREANKHCDNQELPAEDAGKHQQPKQQALQAMQHDSTGADFHPADLFDRQERMALGMRCKQLLDAGRCAWIQSQLLPMMVKQRQQCCSQQPLVHQLAANGQKDTSLACQASRPIHQQSVQHPAAPGSLERQRNDELRDTLYVKRVTYVGASITGENTLLLVGNSVGKDAT